MAGYIAVAVVFSWPLASHLATHLTGDPGGDTGVYVWNQWVFQHAALAEHRNPLTTEHIFSTTGRPVDLTQHNYTLFANLLSVPIGHWLPPVPTFNLVYLATVVITAWMTFVLARRVTGGATMESWLAGAAFAFGPVLVARSTGHFSLVAAAPLAAFLWALHRLEHSESFRDSVLAGLAVAWAAGGDAYYSVYCLDVAAIYIVSRLLRFEWRPEWRHGAGMWLLDFAIVLVAGLVVGLATGRGGRFELFGVPVTVRGLYSPVFLLSLLVLARVLWTLHPIVVALGPPRWRSLGLTAAAGVAGVVALSPTLYGAATRVLDGTWVSPPVYWRSSPRGVDLLALVAPNPSHPLVRALAGYQLESAPTVFVEYTAAVGLVVLGVIVVAMWKAGFRDRGWTWTTAIFAALSLGPFVHVAGVNTYVPGPWAFLRYVPVVNLTRMPGRFAVMVALCASVLFALALRALGERWPARRRTILATVACLLAFELLPVPRTLYSAAVPSVYAIIRDDPRQVRVLELPFGARDGVTSIGDFSARSQFHQTVHGKPLVGGYLSRVSARRFRELAATPTLGSLIALSEGKALTEAQSAALAERGSGFVGRTSLGWVVIHRARASAALVEAATRTFDLELVAADGETELYRPRGFGGPRTPVPPPSSR
ncbi:MAG: glycosyltransferase 87 family protein [Vicinamibacterales bacterium]